MPGNCVPKSLGERLKNPIMGVMVHGIGSYAIPLPPATDTNVNASIECIWRVFDDLQHTRGFKTPPLLTIQGDNHHDNKTPAMYVFIAW